MNFRKNPKFYNQLTILKKVIQPSRGRKYRRTPASLETWLEISSKYPNAFATVVASVDHHGGYYPQLPNKENMSVLESFDFSKYR
jgi:hypothetical protein